MNFLSKRIHKIEKSFTILLFIYAAALPISMSVTNIALAGILISLVLLFVAHKIHFHVPKSIFFLLLFFLWAAVTTMISDGKFDFSAFDSFSKIWNFSPYLLIPLGYKFFEKKEERILKFGTAAACGVVIFGAIQYYHTGLAHFFETEFKILFLVGDRRLHGFQSHPLHAAALYSIFSLMALSAALFYTTYPRGSIIEPHEQLFRSKIGRWWYAVSIICFLGVLLTVSRSYYLGVSAGIILLLSMKGFKHLVIGLALVALFVFVVSRPTPYIVTRISTINPSKTDEAGRQRIWIWKVAAKMIENNPVCGVGYKKWKENLTDYADYYYPLWTERDPAVWGHAHSSYLTVASETGLAGLLLLLLFWGFVVKEEIQGLLKIKKGSFSYALTAGSIGSILSLLVAGFFEHNLLTATPCLTLFFMIGIARASRQTRS